MKVRSLVTIIAVTALFAVSAFAQTLPTPAERTNFQEGPTMYDDLMEYVYDLEESSELMQVQTLTETLTGRKIVLCILSNPAVYKPSDVLNSSTPIVLIVNNVHGSEVAGKDGSLILMRDLLHGELRPLLDKAVVLNIPTINPDGAEVRRRTNELGYDMNRDYLKLESQEIFTLVTKVINEWQPDIHVDTHHGGSTPYVLTMQTNMNPAGDKELMRIGNEEIIPQIRAALNAEDYQGFWYSGPQRDRETREVNGWGPTSVEPRKQHVYSTLANMVGFLFETPGGSHRVINNNSEVVEIPSEERYKHQVRGQYIGQRELIKYAAANPVKLRKTVVDAKRRATMLGMNDSDNDQIPLEYVQEEKFKEEFWYNTVGRGEPANWVKKSLPILTQWSPTRTTTRPWGYILPPQLAHVARQLLLHNISVEKLTAPATVNVEVYYATEVDNSSYFQGHYLKSVKAVKQTEEREFPAGSFFVPAGQPRSNLLCYLLEPETNDNVITWSFLDMVLTRRTAEDAQRQAGRMAQMGQQQRGGRERAPGQLVPIFRVMKKTALQGRLVEANNAASLRDYIK